MDIVLKDTKGVSPETIISIRAGATCHQERSGVPVSSVGKEPFKFPCTLRDCGAIEVDLLTVTASAHADLTPESDQQTITLPIGKQTVPKQAEQLADDAEEGPVDRAAKKTAIAGSAEEYMEKHGVHSMLQGLLRGLTIRIAMSSTQRPMILSLRIDQAAVTCALIPQVASRFNSKAKEKAPVEDLPTLLEAPAWLLPRERTAGGGKAEGVFGPTGRLPFEPSVPTSLQKVVKLQMQAEDEEEAQDAEEDEDEKKPSEAAGDEEEAQEAKEDQDEVPPWFLFPSVVEVHELDAEAAELMACRGANETLLLHLACLPCQRESELLSGNRCLNGSEAESWTWRPSHHFRMAADGRLPSNIMGAQFVAPQGNMAQGNVGMTGMWPMPLGDQVVPMMVPAGQFPQGFMPQGGTMQGMQPQMGQGSMMPQMQNQMMQQGPMQGCFPVMGGL
eukprot:s267_g3.t1